MVGDDVDGGAERTERYDFDLDFVSFLEGRLVEACIALGALFVVVVVAMLLYGWRIFMLGPGGEACHSVAMVGQ